MRAVDYSEILHGSAALAGMQAEDLGAADFALFRTFHDRRLQVAWEIHHWPDLCPIEKRYYRQLYDDATTYAATDERYDLATGKYYQSLHAANVGNDPTVAGVENSAHWAECKNGYSAGDWLTGTVYAIGDQVKDSLTGLYYQSRTAHTAGATLAGDLAANWGLLTPFNKFVAYEQTGETAIAEYFQATNHDPRITSQLLYYPFWLSQDGAQFAVNAPNALWLYYRIRRDTLTGAAWDSGTTYAADDQVYFAETTGGAGNFFSNINAAAGESPADEPTKWSLIELPYFLRGYLIQAGYADWLISDGQSDKAAAHEQFAQQFLEMEVDKLQRQQQQVRRLHVA
jgi:hypothetical protein